MRLIDADELKGCKILQPYKGKMLDGLFIREIDIDDIPTAVVNCKDCKHWVWTTVPGVAEHVRLCAYAGYLVGANGYCAYGERV